MINLILNELKGKSINAILKREFNIPFKLTEHEDYVVLMIVVVPYKERNKGIGNKFMKRLIELSIEQNKDIFITPSGEYSEPEDMKKGALIKWYKGLGFVNKKKSDFRSQNTMVYYTNKY